MYIIRAVDLDTGDTEVGTKPLTLEEARKELGKLKIKRYLSRKPNGQYPMPVHHIVEE